MPTSKKITDFVINKVPSEEVFNKMKAQGLINEDEIYLIAEDISANSSQSSNESSTTKLANARKIRKTSASSSTASVNGSSNIDNDFNEAFTISNDGTGSKTRDSDSTYLVSPKKGRNIVNICNGEILVTGSSITISLDPDEAKKYGSILILLGTPLDGNHDNIYDSFVFPLNPDTLTFMFFNHSLEGKNWQFAKADLSSGFETFTITAVSKHTNHLCFCYLM